MQEGKFEEQGLLKTTPAPLEIVRLLGKQDTDEPYEDHDSG